MVRPFIFPALTIWGTRGTLVLCLSERQPFFAALTQRGELRSAERGDSPRPAASAQLHSLPSDQCNSCRDKLRHPERMPDAIRAHNPTQHDRDRQNDHGIPAQRNHE